MAGGLDLEGMDQAFGSGILLGSLQLPVGYGKPGWG